jgi:hypothetical protein
MSQVQKFADLLPLGLLSILTLKATFVGASIPEMGMYLGISSVVAIATYMSKNKHIEDLTAVLNKQNEVITQMAVEVAKVKNAMESIKLKDGFNASPLTKR